MDHDNHPYRQSFTHGDLTVIDCERCGFKHLWPLPTVDELRDIYEKRFGGDIRPQFREKKQIDKAYWERAFSLRMPVLRELLGDVTQPRLLDVGCGTGTFAAFCKRAGWDVHGVEPSCHFRKDLEAAGITIVPKLIEDISSDEWERMGQFDVVNMSMFLEHVLDPIAVLETVSGRLRNGGILCLESPNDFNPLQLAALEAEGLEAWWISPLHINYFDFGSIEAACRKVGLEPRRRLSQFPIETFLLFGDIYVGDEQLGRSLHDKRVRFERGMIETGRSDLLLAMYEGLAQLGLGRLAIVYASRSGEPT